MNLTVAGDAAASRCPDPAAWLARGGRAALRLASERVLYEIEMFCSISTYFETGVVDDAVQGLPYEGLVVRNALIEAFQLHARQLIDFLTGKDSRDMSASDFTIPKWRQLERSLWRRADFDRVSQRVMHLSLKRAEFTATQQRVDGRRIRRDLGADIRRFLNVGDERRVRDDFLSRAHMALTRTTTTRSHPRSTTAT